jgi:hypothetical protein
VACGNRSWVVDEHLDTTSTGTNHGTQYEFWEREDAFHEFRSRLITHYARVHAERRILWLRPAAQCRPNARGHRAVGSPV